MKNILFSLKVDIINIKYSQLDTSWNYSNINDPFGRIYLVTEGGGTILHSGKVIELEPDHLYLVPANTPSEYYCPDRMNQYWLHFTSELYSGIDLFSLFPATFEVDVSNSLKEVKGYMDRLLDLKNSSNPRDIVERDGLLRLLISFFISDTPKTEQYSSRLKFAPLLRFIENNIGSKLSLKELGAMMHLQPTYLSNSFKKSFGVSLIQYCIIRRIERSKILLNTSSYSLEEISEKLGFNNAFHYSMTFKKHLGISPSKFRKQNNKF